ncbi:hypothetical protein Lal_00043269 [Lupinus albus]|nr:hypothetical protein Lal_00043269 [Lupinus albus]
MLSIAGYWIERDEKGKKSRTNSRPSKRPETTSISYWTILAQARISRSSEVSFAQARDQKSEVYLGGFQQLWGLLLAICTEIEAWEERKSTKVNQKSRGNDSRGKATKDQLQFNPEIEKSAKSNRKKAKAKKKQGISPRRGGASCKTTILADSRPGENPSLKRGYQARKSRPSEKYLSILEEPRPGETFSLKRDIFA